MKVYTKTGDKGTTSLIGGTRVVKNDIRLEAYGGVDELNCFIGMIRSYPIPENLNSQIIEIQNTLFVLGAHLASDETIEKKMCCTEDDIKLLENAMDAMDESLPPMKFFVLPGGNPTVSSCHIARTVCRRVERKIIEMSDTVNIDVFILQYINRLSDYLFVLGRKLACDLGVEEEKWVPKK